MGDGVAVGCEDCRPCRPPSPPCDPRSLAASRRTSAAAAAAAGKKRPASPPLDGYEGVAAAGGGGAWSAHQPGKRSRDFMEKCGECKYCLNPKLKKACAVVRAWRKLMP